MSAIHDAPNRSIQNTYSTRNHDTKTAGQLPMLFQFLGQVGWFQWVAIGRQSARDTRVCDNLRQVNHMAVLIGPATAHHPCGASRKFALKAMLGRTKQQSRHLPLCVIICSVLLSPCFLRWTSKVQKMVRLDPILVAGGFRFPRQSRPGQVNDPAFMPLELELVYAVYLLLPPGACPVNSGPALQRREQFRDFCGVNGRPANGQRSEAGRHRHRNQRAGYQYCRIARLAALSARSSSLVTLS